MQLNADDNASADNVLPFPHLDGTWQVSKLRYAFWQRAWLALFRQRIQENEFLLKHLSGIHALDETGARHPVELGKIAPGVKIHDIELQFAQLRLTCKKRDAAQGASSVYSIEGFRYDYQTAPSQNEWVTAMDEKIAGALILVNTALADGASRVNIDGNRDPLDKLILFETCRKHGLECHGTLTMNDLPSAPPYAAEERLTVDEYREKIIHHVRFSLNNPVHSEIILVPPETPALSPTGRPKKSLADLAKKRSAAQPAAA